jgi:hypothetical protein
MAPRGRAGFVPVARRPEQEGSTEKSWKDPMQSDQLCQGTGGDIHLKTEKAPGPQIGSEPAREQTVYFRRAATRVHLPHRETIRLEWFLARVPFPYHRTPAAILRATRS